MSRIGRDSRHMIRAQRGFDDRECLGCDLGVALIRRMKAVLREKARSAVSMLREREEVDVTPARRRDRRARDEVVGLRQALHRSRMVGEERTD